MPFYPSAELLEPLAKPSASSHSDFPLTSSTLPAPAPPPAMGRDTSTFSSLPPSSSTARSSRAQKEQEAKIRYEQMVALNKERQAQRKKMREEARLREQGLSGGAGRGNESDSLGSSTSTGSEGSLIPTSTSSSDTPPSSISTTGSMDQMSYAINVPYESNHSRPTCTSRSNNRPSQPTQGSLYPFDRYAPLSTFTQINKQAGPQAEISSLPNQPKPLPISVGFRASQPLPRAAPLPESNVQEDDDTALKRLMQEAEARQNAPVQAPVSVSRPYMPVITAASRTSDDLQRVESRLRTETETGSTGVTVHDNRDTGHLVQSIRVLTDSENERRQRAITFLEGLFLKLLGDIVRSTKILNEREMGGGGIGASKKMGLKRGKRKLGVEGEVEDDGVVERDEGEEEGDEGEEVASLVNDQRGGNVNDEKNEVGIKMRLRNRTTGEDQVVSYPDDPTALKKETALHKLSCRFRIAELLYEAILKQCVTTKRDIYYKDVQLFKTQPVVDKIVDDMVATAGLKRQDFMVCAASKGLVASPTLRIHLKSGEELSLSASNASLIPPIERIARVEAEGGVRMVLIVEKDAVFQTLLSLQLLNQPGLGQAVLVTGKGYPDLATLQLCKLISVTYPLAKFHALVDADPHGIDIMQVYAKGSKSTTHSHDHAGLALGARLHWMGVKASEWLGLGIKHDDLLMLSDKDVEKAMAMLKRQYLPLACRRELQHMLHLNRKAEIQILSSIGGNQDTLESVYANGPSSMEARAGDGKRTGLLGYVTERLLVS